MQDADDICTPHGLTTTWSFAELERQLSSKTRIIALSHVQFPSGMACDLKRIGDFCAANAIDFVVDAAQGLGALPLAPEEMGIAAVVSSGWKWLLGPVGTGILYTSPAFRDKLSITMAGADMMQQGSEYLDHRWAPYTDGRRFEYSTHNIAGIAGLTCAIQEIAVRYGTQVIRDEIFRLQDLAAAQINRDLFFFHERSYAQRSGILALVPLKTTPEALVVALAERQIMCSVRDGYLRVAPHIYNTDDDIAQLVEALNRHGMS